MVQSIRFHCYAESQKFKKIKNLHVSKLNTFLDSFPSNKINIDIFLGVQICEFTYAFIFFIRERLLSLRHAFWRIPPPKKITRKHTHKKQCCVGDRQAATTFPKGFLGRGYISKEDLQSLKDIIPEQFWFPTLVMGICLLDSPCGARSGPHCKGPLEKAFPKTWCL